MKHKKSNTIPPNVECILVPVELIKGTPNNYDLGERVRELYNENEMKPTRQHAERLVRMYETLLGGRKTEAKQCAIATINEVVGELADQEIDDSGYYEEVRKEIERL